MTAEDQAKRISDIVQELMFKFYPLAPILNNIKFKMSDKIPTAAVDASGRGLFNPAFAERLNDSELRFVIAHEALHVLLRHHKRAKGIEHVDHQLFNVAADCYINENLKTSTSFIAPEGLVDFELVSKRLGDDYSYSTMLDENTEDLYERLAASSEGNGGSGNATGDGDGAGDPDDASGDSSDSDGSGSSNTLDGDIQQDEAISSEYGDATELESNKMEGAANEASYRLGAGGDKGNSDIDIVSKALPVDASKILSRFTYTVSGRSTVCRSYRRPSRRYREIYPISAGKTRKARRDVVFSIDVSGSMDSDKISKVVAFLVSLGREFTVGSKFMFFNSDHSDIYEFKNMDDFKQKLSAHYGGGTCLDAALYDYKIDENADGVVIISDMEFSEDISDSLLSSHVRCPYMLVGVDVRDPKAINVKRDNIILF